MQSVKETAQNVSASAKAGMEKAKAEAQEKVDKMKTSDPMEKDMATQRKEERKSQADWEKMQRGTHGGHAGAGGFTGGQTGYGTTGTGHGGLTGGQTGYGTTGTEHGGLTGGQTGLTGGQTGYGTTGTEHGGLTGGHGTTGIGHGGTGTGHGATDYGGYGGTMADRDYSGGSEEYGTTGGGQTGLGGTDAAGQTGIGSQGYNTRARRHQGGGV